MTERQKQYAELYAAGLSKREIASRCGVVQGTVHNALVAAGVIDAKERERPRQRPEKMSAPQRIFTLSVPPAGEMPEYAACPHRDRGGMCSILTDTACRRPPSGGLPCGFFPGEIERRRNQGIFVPIPPKDTRGGAE